MAQRFLTLEQVADELAISMSQAYALVRRGDLAAMKVGGRGQWRIARANLETYIEDSHRRAAQWIEDHPAGDDEDAK